jgi:hypothetical protein
MLLGSSRLRRDLRRAGAWRRPVALPSGRVAQPGRSLAVSCRPLALLRRSIALLGPLLLLAVVSDRQSDGRASRVRANGRQSRPGACRHRRFPHRIAGRDRDPIRARSGRQALPVGRQRADLLRLLGLDQHGLRLGWRVHPTGLPAAVRPRSARPGPPTDAARASRPTGRRGRRRAGPAARQRPMPHRRRHLRAHHARRRPSLPAGARDHRGRVRRTADLGPRSPTSDASRATCGPAEAILEHDPVGPRRASGPTGSSKVRRSPPVIRPRQCVGDPVVQGRTCRRRGSFTRVPVSRYWLAVTVTVPVMFWWRVQRKL